MSFKDAVQRDGEALLAQLAQYYTNVVRNTFVSTDAAREAARTLPEALTWHKRVVVLLRDWSLPKDTFMKEPISQWKATVAPWSI